MCRMLCNLSGSAWEGVLHITVMRMFSQLLCDLASSVDHCKNEGKKEKKSAFYCGCHVFTYFFFSITWAYKLIGISVRHSRYHGRGLAIFLVKNLSSNYWFLVLFVNFSSKYGS